MIHPQRKIYHVPIFREWREKKKAPEKQWYINVVSTKSRFCLSPFGSFIPLHTPVHPFRLRKLNVSALWPKLHGMLHSFSEAHPGRIAFHMATCALFFLEEAPLNGKCNGAKLVNLYFFFFFSPLHPPSFVSKGIEAESMSVPFMWFRVAACHCRIQMGKAWGKALWRMGKKVVWVGRANGSSSARAF